ncbi:MAG: hypothetical protein JWO41_55 [Candidatus Saccharibacteria bacterium]|nr:hypothetical protein [Candidatus Saccharibacteria bacterium]
MVSKQSVEKQLKRIHFNHLSWGTSEVQELPNILLPDESILECVNGIYEGGFALLVATDMRVLLIDKKPLKYLTVEDLRFDMISEIDYSHRLFGARINISTGSKNLKFNSFNQPRLRSLIGHVQNHMATIKKQQHTHQVDQKTHLEQINQQLQSYLLAQYEQQETLKQELQKSKTASIVLPDPIEMSSELKDYMLAQRLLAEQAPTVPVQESPQPITQAATPRPYGDPANPQLADLYSEGMQEIFGRQQQAAAASAAASAPQPQPVAAQVVQPPAQSLEVNPISIAYSKLPLALRNRKFGRPSFHAHSQQAVQQQPLQPHPTPQV